MRLFEPGRIGSMIARNRVVMCPMGTGRLSEQENGLQRVIDYYAARAAGGVGTIITGASIVDTTVEAGFAQLAAAGIQSSGELDWLRDLCIQVHQHDTRIIIQLSPGFGRLATTPTAPPQPVSASVVPCYWNPRVMTREMEVPEIERLVRACGTAAANAKSVGADAVEIHGYGGYLIDQFQTALWNKRTDRYGGDLEGRLRFSMEIIEAIRGAVGPDFPVIFKFTPAHYIEGGRELEEGLGIARRLEEAGVDALHVDLGCYEVWYRVIPSMYEPPACQVHLSEAVKGVVDIPVIAHGKLGYPDIAEAVLEEGKADFVALGRPLLADPEWPLKVREGRLEDIRPCIGDMEGCISGTGPDRYTSCSLNPQTGNEREYALTPATTRRSVLVIGGGPGGMEAARVAARRGNRVVLWEKSDRLGGTLIPASAPEFKKDIRRLIDYLSAQLSREGVEVELGREAALEMVQQANPDVVIVATGGVPVVPPIPGVQQERVCTAVDVLLGRREAAGSVVVVGGGMVGCETAAHLAGEGRAVTVIEMMPRLVPEGASFIAKMGLVNLLRESGVTVLTGTKLLEINGGGAVVASGGESSVLEADTVILAVGFRPVSSLLEALEGKVPELHGVGDCVRPGKILDAVWGAFHVARKI